jgi:hypothetical protein
MPFYLSSVVMFFEAMSTKPVQLLKVCSIKPSGKHSINFIQAYIGLILLSIQYIMTCFDPYTGHPQVFFVCVGWSIFTLRYIHSLLFCMGGGNLYNSRGCYYMNMCVLCLVLAGILIKKFYIIQCPHYNETKKNEILPANFKIIILILKILCISFTNHSTYGHDIM